MPKGNGVDWEEPLVFDERKSSKSRDDSVYSDCHSHSRHENNVENNAVDANQNQNKSERKFGKDSGSISSYNNKEYIEVREYIH